MSALRRPSSDIACGDAATKPFIVRAPVRIGWTPSRLSAASMPSFDAEEAAAGVGARDRVAVEREGRAAERLGLGQPLARAEVGPDQVGEAFAVGHARHLRQARRASKLSSTLPVFERPTKASSFGQAAMAASSSGSLPEV